MAESSILDIYKLLDDDNIILSYKGAINTDVIMSLISILENKIKSFDIRTDLKRRVMRVLIECFQNLNHHVDAAALDTEQTSESNALIIVQQIGDQFIIKTGNVINESDLVQLQRRIAMVNALNTDELRDLYRKKLENESFSKKVTAGLGFIDIARKSKQKLSFEVMEMVSRKCFFCLNVTVG